MAYATKADLISAFGEQELIQLTDRENIDEVSDDLLTSFIASADGEIDSYIGAVYDLPLPAVTAIIVEASCNIARFRMYSTRATEEVRARYDDTIRWLRDVAKGVSTLGFPVETVPASKVVVAYGRTQVFSDARFDTMNLL